MFKKMRFLLVAICIWLLTGCGNKTEVLTCDKSEDLDGIMMHQTMEMELVNNELTTMKIDIDMDLTEEYASYMGVMKDTLSEEYKKFTDNGASVDIISEGNVIKVSVVNDFTTMTQEQKDNLDIGVFDTYGTKEATKKELEKEGYTCR